MNIVIKIFKKPRGLFLTLLEWTAPMWSDKCFLKLKFRLEMRRKLHLNNPTTFNEKLQWIKLYDHNPLYTIMVDKVKAKEYVAEKLGEEYIIPTLGVWERAEDVDFDCLPNQFVIKCNHNSGTGMFICKDKTTMNEYKVRKELAKGLKESYFNINREWPYKNVPRRILAEQFMVDGGNEDVALVDYKFFCYDGKADVVMLCIGRETGDTKFYFFDRDWNLVRCNIRGKAAPEGFTLPKPETMDEMFKIADKLSEGSPFMRVDLYSVNNKIYFGEMTFFPDSGMDPNLLPETDLAFGAKVKLKNRT